MKVIALIMIHITSKSSVPKLYLSFHPFLTWKLVLTLLCNYLKEFSTIRTQASNINFPKYFVEDEGN